MWTGEVNLLPQLDAEVNQADLSISEGSAFGYGRFPKDFKSMYGCFTAEPLNSGAVTMIHIRILNPRDDKYYLRVFKYYNASKAWVYHQTDIVQDSDPQGHLEDSSGNFLWLDIYSGKLYVIESWAMQGCRYRYHKLWAQLSRFNWHFISSVWHNDLPTFLLSYLPPTPVQNEYMIFQVDTGGRLPIVRPLYNLGGSIFYMIRGRSGYASPPWGNEIPNTVCLGLMHGTVHAQFYKFEYGLFQEEERRSVSCNQLEIYGSCRCRGAWVLWPKDGEDKEDEEDKEEGENEEDGEDEEEGENEEDEVKEYPGEQKEDEASLKHKGPLGKQWIEGKLFELEAIEAKVQGHKSNRAISHKEAAALKASVKVQQRQLALQRLRSMVEAEHSYHKIVLHILPRPEVESQRIEVSHPSAAADNNVTSPSPYVLAATQTPGEAGKRWFQGTADAVRQLAWVFEVAKNKNVEHILILSGDHLHGMDYMDFVQKHIDTNADIIVSCICMDDSHASDYGLMKIDDRSRIIHFAEKPKGPVLKAMQVDTSLLGLTKQDALKHPYIASMGVFVFRTDVLLKLLKWKYPSCNDFGFEIIPSAVKDHNVQAYLFSDYWEDVGTIKSFFDANLALSEQPPKFDFNDPKTPFFTSHRFLPPTKVEKCRIVVAIISHGLLLTRM